MYKFPEIRNIEQVLPHIEGYAISKIDRNPGRIVLNYAYAYPDLFHVDSENPTPGLIRRECRGITFDSETGDIVSRPFNKFFNLGETTETLPKNIDFSQDHYRVNKHDGSMIHVCLNKEGQITFYTRAGESEVAQDAMKFYMNNRTIASDWFLYDLLALGLTPIFEWENPNKNIVLKHDKPALVFLAARHIITGRYDHEAPFSLDDIPAPFTPLDLIGKVDKIETYSDMIAASKGIEGEIIVFPETDFIIKVKTDEYRALHGFRTNSVKGRHVLSYFLNGTLDDLLASIEDEEIKQTYYSYANKFANHITDTLDNVMESAYVVRDLERKHQFHILSDVLSDKPAMVKPAMRFLQTQEKDGLRNNILKIMEQATFSDTGYNEYMSRANVDAPNMIFNF